MVKKTATARKWCRDDVVDLLGKYDCLDKVKLERGKVEYKGLIDQKKLVLKPEQYHLVFGQDPEDEVPFDLEEDQLRFIIGDDWEQKKETYVNRKDSIARVLGRDGFNMRLDEVPNELCFDHFDMLAPGKDINVNDVSSLKKEEVPPLINLSIALSLWACSNNRGLLPWQSKDLSSKKKMWEYRKVPDLMLVDYQWGQQERDAFWHGSYETQRAFLDAESRLRSTDPVLPFIVDFPDTRQDKKTLARSLSTAIRERGILAAISVSDTAYIGWVHDMVGNASADTDTCVPSLR